MNIAIAADHAGYQMKGDLVVGLESEGHVVADLGTGDESSCDYPDYAAAVAERVATGEAGVGVLICGTGVGMAIAANKAPGIRAAAVSDPVSAALARSHNNANIVCLGARIVGPEVAAAIVRAFLETPFCGGERHRRRVAKLDALDAVR